MPIFCPKHWRSATVSGIRRKSVPTNEQIVGGGGEPFCHIVSLTSLWGLPWYYFHFRARLFSLGCAALLCLGAGCEPVHFIYEIDLRPKGDQIERTLTLRLSNTGGTNEPPAAELAKLARIYPNTFQPDQKKTLGFVGTFRERMPDDVGGRGSYLRFTNRMGSSYSYVERFRGDADGAGQIERRQLAAQTMARLSRGWCKQEFGREPGWPKLREYIDQQLAHDLLAVSLFATPVESPAAGDPSMFGLFEFMDQFAVRFGQYLLERGYIAASELPALVRRAQAEWDNRGWLAAVVGHHLGRSPTHPALAVIADEKRMKASWEKYVTSRETIKLLAEYAKKKPWPPHAEDPKPEEALEILGSSLQGGPTAPSDDLTVRLHVSFRPHDTNGEWDEETHAVLWKDQDLSRQLPTLCFAAWSEPAIGYQTEHFGNVILDEDALAEYSHWYRELANIEAADWDRFLDDLKPNEELVERLESFRFSSGATADRAELLKKSILKKRDESEAKPPPEAGRQK
ncbi:MAG: hypothetical protein EXS31_14330 [Pedosphaera sp.]|nr:hypothetical protein [Pedosphaera sp.]